MITMKAFRLAEAARCGVQPSAIAMRIARNFYHINLRRKNPRRVFVVGQPRLRKAFTHLEPKPSLTTDHCNPTPMKQTIFLLIGPMACGKTTLARELSMPHSDVVATARSVCFTLAPSLEKMRRQPKFALCCLDDREANQALQKLKLPQATVFRFYLSQTPPARLTTDH